MSTILEDALLLYGLPLLAVWALYTWRRVRRSHASGKVLAASLEQGLMEPASLHPLIDPIRCLGCGACVDACPEKNVLGLVAGRAVLTTPANCIGHGACKQACPFDAIELVLGTENRGIAVPVLDSNFETVVPGIFVAGELGGMGLIRNGIAQGRQAIDSIGALAGMGEGERLDVVIVGAGPAGFAASLTALERGLRYRTLEQESLGGTVAHYPRGKVVMTAPVELPGFGKVKLRETTKEALLDLWKQVAAETGVEIDYGRRVEGIEVLVDGFEVVTATERLRTRAVLLAIGRRGTPRKLGVPGEELPKVVYRMIDPQQYRDRDVLVVGGGDSALEAAVAISEERGSRVALAYRGEAFSRAKAKNREKVEAARDAGRLQLLLGSQPLKIESDAVEIDTPGGVKTLANDDVIICVGGILPTTFLESIGVRVETRRGEVA